MFRRKFRALGYHKTDINLQDEQQWRNLIVWLEDQKIRMYKIEDRKRLRDTSTGNWSKVFSQYLDDLECTVDRSNRKTLCDWLLGVAVRTDYGENVEKYNTSQKVTSSNSDAVDDPFAQLDVNSADFKAGLLSICHLLKIPEHYDPITTLQAVSLLVKDRLSEEAQSAVMEEGEDFDLSNYEVGFETRDEVINNASCILRLLHIQELRDLQTKINEAIVCVQRITANPKTDQRLGKVGR
ncbi:RNA transcription, translation and transport factor protein-like [Apostichopus japonicus]|uniref:RNA transcription, translation and transport factor protein-like n=1 Tax=Stichopus japonicus TaxID=307972 RepID=UPI003AB2D3F7